MKGLDFLRSLLDIRAGTLRYPEKVARRLRAVNLTAWLAAAVAAAYAVAQFIDSTPGLWKPSTVNPVAGLALTLIPLLHRLGPARARVRPTVIAQLPSFVDCALGCMGTGC